MAPRPAPPGARLERARALYDRGVLENARGRFARASTLLNRALGQLPEGGAPQHPEAGPPGAPEWTRLYVQVRLSLSTCLSELHGLDRGVSALDELGPLVRAAGHPDLEVSWHDRRGWILFRAGRLEEALADLTAAARQLEAADADTAYAILLNRGMAHLYLGDLAAAEADFAGALLRGPATSDPIDEAVARHNLGYIEYLRGNFARALRQMPEAAELSTDFLRGTLLMDRSRVLIEAGLVDAADEALAEASARFAAGRLWPDLAEADLARAECALLAGEDTAALRLARGALRRFRATGNERGAQLAQLARMQARLTAGRTTTAHLREAGDLAGRFAQQRAPAKARQARLLAAEFALRLGQVQEARRWALAAGATRPADPVALRLHTRLVRARVADAEGRAAAARSHLRTGMAELARHQAGFGGADMQTAAAVHGRALADLDLSLALRDGKAAAVFAAVERFRAASSRALPVAAPQDPALAAALAELRRLTREQHDEEAAGGAAPASLTDRVGELQRQLRARSWEVAGAGATESAATLPQVRAQLDGDGATLVSYFQHRHRTFAVVVGGGRCTVRDLGPSGPVTELCHRTRADLDALALPIPHPRMRAALTVSANRTLRLLEAVLLRPLAARGGPLVVLPTGPLCALPWSALPSLRGRPVVVAPSAHTWHRAASPTGRTAAAGAVVALAGPALPHAAAEVAAVAGLWPGGVALTQATHADLSGALAAAQVVHVAAHGYHQARNPLFSSLYLHDGNMFAYELEHRGWASDHVVLSACEVGRATLRAGDEALGLTSVLLRLGARSVVSGVSRVRDELSAQVMVAYHRHLAGGADSAGALASAAAEFPEELVPFVCFGSAWRATPP